MPMCWPRAGDSCNKQSLLLVADASQGWPAFRFDLTSSIEWTAGSRRASAVIHPLVVDVWFAAIAAARRRIAINRSLTNNRHPSSDADDWPMTGFRCAADSDHQVEGARSLDVRCHAHHSSGKNARLRKGIAFAYRRLPHAGA